MSVRTRPNKATVSLRTVQEDWARIAKDWEAVVGAWRPVMEDGAKTAKDWEAVLRSCVVAEDKFLAEISRTMDDRSL